VQITGAVAEFDEAPITLLKSPLHMAKNVKSG